MSAHKPGDPIDLCWEDRPEEWVVRGHVGDDVASAWAIDWCEGYDEPMPSRWVVRHMWARWVWITGGDGPQRCLHTYYECSRGTFPVTVAFDGDDWD